MVLSVVELVVEVQAEAVGHAGDVVADDAVGAHLVEALAVAVGQQFGPLQVGRKEVFELVLGAVLGLRDGGVFVDPFEQEPFQFGDALTALGGKVGERPGCPADIIDAAGLVFFETVGGLLEGVGDEHVDEALGTAQLPGDAFGLGELASEVFLEVLIDADLGKVVLGNKLGGEGVVEVVGVVGDGVGEVGDLAFEGCLAGAVFVAGLGQVVGGAVLDEALARFEGEIEASEGGVGVFEVLDDA